MEGTTSVVPVLGMIELAQDIAVTSVAAVAALLVVRRVAGAVRPAKGQAQPTCPSCASGTACASKHVAINPSNPHASKPSEGVFPVTLVR